MCVCGGGVPYQDVFARCQQDKMVSISVVTLEAKCLKIIVACQEFKMEYFLQKLHFLSSLKSRHTLTVLFLVARVRNSFH